MRGLSLLLLILSIAFAVSACTKSDAGATNGSGTGGTTQLNWDQGNWNQSNWQ